MKTKNILLITVLLLFIGGVTANEIHNPEFVSVSAKYAKLKAKQRALKETSYKDISQSINPDSDDSSGSCDLNVGNVVVDDSVGGSPDDVVIIIEGDIFQSNNC